MRPVFSERANLHIALAGALVAVWSIKVLIARRYKKMANLLPAFGSVLFVLAVATVVPVGGASLGLQLGYQPAAEVVGPVKSVAPTANATASLPPTEKIFVNRCGECHPLGQTIYAVGHTAKKDEWPAIVKRMQEKTDRITDADTQSIVAYLQGFYE